MVKVLIRRVTPYLLGFISVFSFYPIGLLVFLCQYIYIYTHTVLKCDSEVKLLNRVRLFVTLRTVAYQAPLSMGFSRQDTGVGCHALLQGIFPTRDWTSLAFPALAGGFFTTSAIGKPITVVWSKGKTDVEVLSKMPNSLASRVRAPVPLN